jgi:hypothetical protein
VKLNVHVLARPTFAVKVTLPPALLTDDGETVKDLMVGAPVALATTGVPSTMRADPRLRASAQSTRDILNPLIFNP